MVQYKREHLIILTMDEAVLTTGISENYFSSGMVIILIKVCILSNIFAGKFIHNIKVQDKSSDIEQQPPFGDCK